MSVPTPTWTSVRKLFADSRSSLPDLFFARRFCILVALSAFITSQGDFDTTQRIVEGLSSLAGIDQKTRWKYISIMIWKASEFGIGWWLDCTGTVSCPKQSSTSTETTIIGPEVASLALLSYIPITYVLASASTTTSVSSLLVNVLATSGPYYFLQQKPLNIQPPRRQTVQTLGRDSWWWRWVGSATAAVIYSLIIHHAATEWALPYIRKYFPFARHVLRPSDLNRKWLLCSIPFISVALWNFFRVEHPTTRNFQDKKSKVRMHWLEELRVLTFIKRLSVILLLSSALTWVQLKAKSERP